MLNWRYVHSLEQAVDLRAVLGEGKIFCPNHDDSTTPNCHVYADHLYCFACGWHEARKFQAIQAVHPDWTPARIVGELKAAAALGKYAARVEPPAPALPSVDELRTWAKQLVFHDDMRRILSNRGINDVLASTLLLGWTGSALAIPHLTMDAERFVVHGVKYRRPFWSDGSPKYWSAKGSVFGHPWPWHYFQKHPVLYEDRVLLVEGELDAAMLLSQDFPALSVPSGAQSDISPFIGQLPTRVLLAGDQDDVGLKASQALAGVLAAAGKDVTLLVWPSVWGKDVSDVYRNGYWSAWERRVAP